MLRIYAPCATHSSHHHREKKAELSETCANELLEEMKEGADDFRKDPRLFETCKLDADTWCKDVDPKEGGVQDCLRNHRPRLSWDCQDELFRQDMENADDLRLSVKLFRKCLKDKRKVCDGGIWVGFVSWLCFCFCFLSLFSRVVFFLHTIAHPALLASSTHTFLPPPRCTVLP